MFQILKSNQQKLIISIMSNNKVNKPKNTKQEQQIDPKNQTIAQLYQMAESLYQSISSTAQSKWHNLISSSGTKKDKINLMATQIIQNPQSCLNFFEQLSQWCSHQNHNFALDSCKALTNVYEDYVFNNQKKSLNMFVDSVQKFIKENKKKTMLSEADLIGFYLEHHIKQFYSEMIKSIEHLLLNATVPFIKKTCVSLLAKLAKNQELRRLILSVLINKFGDRDLEIVNEITKNLKTEYYGDLQSSQTLLEECQAFLFRTNVSDKASFYVINFLNGINIKFVTDKAMIKLFKLFYHFFEKLIDKQEDGSLSSRLFLNSIKGLNRVFGQAKEGNKSIKGLVSDKIDSIYKTIHKTSNTKAKIQLYLFLFQAHSHISSNLPDRYYRSLYEFISKQEILHCSLNQLFFDLTLITLKEDSSLNRCLAFTKRLLQLCFSAEANFVTTMLIMVGKLMQQKQPLKIMMGQRQNDLIDDENDEKGYDMWKREPIYSGAQKTCLWELTIFQNHYHPTVRKYAGHLLKGEVIPYQGNNPLVQLSQTAFIEKMTLRKQKKSDSWKIKVKKNLSKIRSSKYESLLDNPTHNFKEDETYIQKYLEKRTKIHQNFRKIQTQDIEQFADGVIQKEMDRLNPQDDFDLSISQEGQSMEQVQQGSQGQFEYEEGEREEEGDEFQDGQFGSDEDVQNDQVEFNSQNSDDENEDQQISQSKDFADVFDEVGDSDQQYPKKKKTIKKPFKKPQRNKKNIKSQKKKR